MKIKIVLFLLITTVLNVFAQKTSGDIGSWSMLFNQTRLHDKWSLHSEIQFRSYDIKPNTEQLLIRAGINFHYNANLVLTAGYGWITNYLDDELVFKQQYVNENRIWEQVVLKNNVNRVAFEHRYRLEQRWIETKIETKMKRNKIDRYKTDRNKSE